MSTVIEKEAPVLWDAPTEKEKFYVEQLSQQRERPIYETVKRLFDFIVSFIALIVLAIPMLIISLLIVWDSPGCPIYSQVRLGKDEKPFTLYKFRSMRKDAEADGLRWAEDGDPRITRIGHFLRNTRMDELPQLWNILKGEMSFVGPRPERPEFYAIFDTYIVGFRQRMMVTPGLTGLAQVNGGYDLRPEEKILYDIEYIKTRSLWLDCECLLRTFGVVLMVKGAR